MISKQVALINTLRKQSEAMSKRVSMKNPFPVIIEKTCTNYKSALQNLRKNKKLFLIEF